MKILIDTNIILDIVQNRKKFFDASNQIFKDCICKKHTGFITAHSISDVFFISRKSHNIESRKSIIKLLCNFFTILSEGKEDFLAFVDNADWNDLEDALQMKCSENANLDYIITRDAENGFRNSPVKIISPENFLNLK